MRKGCGGIGILVDRNAKYFSNYNYQSDNSSKIKHRVTHVAQQSHFYRRIPPNWKPASNILKGRSGSSVCCWMNT